MGSTLKKVPSDAYQTCFMKNKTVFTRRPKPIFGLYGLDLNEASTYNSDALEPRRGRPLIDLLTINSDLQVAIGDIRIARVPDER
jgi:hypothetical protein